MEHSNISNCPICGKKGVVSLVAPDGFFMGYSIGCPSYRKNDGVHNRIMALHNVDTKEMAIAHWNKYCEKVKNEI